MSAEGIRQRRLQYQRPVREAFERHHHRDHRAEKVRRDLDRTDLVKSHRPAHVGYCESV
jgi:hypothetical protein